MSHITCFQYLFFDIKEKVWKGISLMLRINLYLMWKVDPCGIHYNEW
jgi:hypothetical protein